MRNYRSSIPTFGKYEFLLNEKVRPEVAKMNDWHFGNFSKKCLLKYGFLSIIRFLYDDTLYLKLYYFDNKVRENKREMEQFVSSYYLHEMYQLKYTKCNIIRIPLKINIEDEVIELQDDTSSIESLLQLQLTEDSWIGVDYTGTQGGLTIGANPDSSVHRRRKELLLEGYMNPNYEEKVNKWVNNFKSNISSTWVRIIRESDGLSINISPEKFVLSWNSVPMEVQASHSIQFKWKGVYIKLTVLEFYGQRSNIITAIVEYLNKSFNFGFGRSSVGAGSMGVSPKFVVGNQKLQFQFGKNCISVSEITIDPRLELMKENTDSNFQLLV